MADNVDNVAPCGNLLCNCLTTRRESNPRSKNLKLRISKMDLGKRGLVEKVLAFERSGDMRELEVAQLMRISQCRT